MRGNDRRVCCRKNPTDAKPHGFIGACRLRSIAGTLDRIEIPMKAKVEGKPCTNESVMPDGVTFHDMWEVEATPFLQLLSIDMVQVTAM